jgi:hypothetical protein
MTYQPVINVDGSGQDGAMVCWDAGCIKISDLHSALNDIGLVSLGPKSSVLSSALSDAFSEFLDKVPGLKEWGKPVKLYRLDPEVIGWTARKINPDKEDIDPVFVASVVLGDSGIPKIIKYNSELIPQLDTKRAQFEAALNKIYQTRIGYFPTNMVTQCFNKVVQALGGILVKRTGGLYFIPEDGIEKFEQFANSLDGKGDVELVTVRFPVVPSERSYAMVLRAVTRVAKERLAAVEKSLAELGTEKRQRSNGKESRLNECRDVLEMLKNYEEILGVDMTGLKQMAEKIQKQVDVHDVLDFCA